MISIISSLIVIILNSIILKYVYELESKDCSCSLDWQHRFVKYIAPVIIVVALCLIFVNPKIIISMMKKYKIIALLVLVYSVLVVLYSINMVVYFLKLVHSKCKCSEDWKRWGLLYPAAVFSIMLFVAVIVNLLSIFDVLPKKLSASVKSVKSKNNSYGYL